MDIQKNKLDEKGVDLEKKIFSKKIRTIAKIEDFRLKFFMRFWNYFPQEKCSLCKEDFGKKEKNLTINHILYKCRNIKKWEAFLKINSDQRKKDNFDGTSPNHLCSWIHSWCLWRIYWDVAFDKFENSSKKKAQLSKLIGLVKLTEYKQLMFHIFRIKKNDPHTSYDNFIFFDLNEENKIIEK